MAPLTDRTIDALSAEHKILAATVRDLTDDQLTLSSAAAEWTVAQVLSHLGSGAEITTAGLQAALGRRTAPDENFNPSVWDRWNAMSPVQQRAGFLKHDAVLVAAVTALDQQQRETLQWPSTAPGSTRPGPPAVAWRHCPRGRSPRSRQP
ncbi:MAG: maleylpyruvate isomerase N-terminal domain-containing protein [Terracoccus sp.]